MKKSGYFFEGLSDLPNTFIFLSLFRQIYHIQTSQNPGDATLREFIRRADQNRNQAFVIGLLTQSVLNLPEH